MIIFMKVKISQGKKGLLVCINKNNKKIFLIFQILKMQF